MTEKLGSVLVVDDSAINLNLLIDYLTYANFEVYAAEEGQSALDLLDHIQPDVILMDVMMPEMNGFEACLEIKARPDLRHIPVIFMTALADTADKIKGFEAGGADYITKPVQYEEVLARLKMHLELSRLQKRLRDQNQQLQREIAERKRTEIELRESEEKFRTISHSAQDAVIMIDSEDRISFWNEAAERMFGYAAEAVRGRALRQLIVPERYFAIYDRAFAGFKDTGISTIVGRTFAFAGIREDGSEIPLEVSLSAINLQGKWHAIGIARDVTERLKAQQALRQSQEYLAAIFNAVHTGIVLVDAETRTIADVNPAALEMIGAARDDVVGQSCRRFLCLAEAEQGPVLDLEMGVDNLEQSLITAQGAVVPVIKSAAPIALDDRAYLLESFVSIAERKRVEEALHQYTRELEASNAELDAFAHTVAHDLKNPLTAMIGISGMLQEHQTHLSAAEIDKRLSVITRAGHRMTSIINELLLLASVRKVDEVERVRLDMDAVVADAYDRIEHLIEPAQAQIVLPDSWPVAVGYAPWIEEVWANYISNAIKYGGQPETGTPPHIVLGATEMPDAGTVRFWVRDNGPGLPPDQTAKLFAPFERLGQAHTAGHGLGLSIVRRIVEKLGGEVGVESGVGTGSIFYFTLPVV